VLKTETPNQEAGRFFDHGDFENDFFSRVSQLIASVDYRRVDSRAHLDPIGRLRDEAYRREGAIPTDFAKAFIDPYDETDNAYIFGLYIAGGLASSLRLHIGSKSQLTFPSLEVFPEYLRPELEAGKVLVDTTRFVADERLSRRHRDLPYATLRLCMLAAEHFGADRLLIAVGTPHQAFYRRAFDCELICGPRLYPHTPKPMSLMALSFPSAADSLVRRYPFFHSSRSERQRLFERWCFPMTSGQEGLDASEQRKRKASATLLLSSVAGAG
jgi:N-acyl-L-homoserine lactone synthetase